MGRTDRETVIENIVTSTYIGTDLDLETIAEVLEGATYIPETFPCLIYRLKDHKPVTLLFRSGKTICTGAKSMDEVHTVIKSIIEKLTNAEIVVNNEYNILVRNMIASFDYGTEINLNAVGVTLGTEKVEYAPKEFPGLIYHIPDTPIELLLFTSGKLVCTGGTNRMDIDTAIDKITDELNTAGLLS